MTDAQLSEEDQYLLALGGFVHAWSMLEAAIDFAIVVIFQRYGGNSLIRKQPRTLKTKIIHLKNCYFTLPTLGTYAAEGIGIVERLATMRDTRHHLIHGTPMDLSASVIEVRLIRPEGAKHQVNKGTTTVANLVKMTNTTYEVCLQMQEHSFRLFNDAIHRPGTSGATQDLTSGS